MKSFYTSDNAFIDLYLWSTSSVVTVDVVDMTFFPATSTASHTLPIHKKIKT